MKIDKRKIKKFQKISMWILFLCIMVWISMISVLLRPEDDPLSGLALILLGGTFVIAVLDMLAMFLVQFTVESKIKGWKTALRSIVINFLIYLGVGALLVAGLTFFRGETFQLGLLRKIFGFAVIAGAGSYMGRFWTLKISE